MFPLKKYFGVVGCGSLTEEKQPIGTSVFCIVYLNPGWVILNSLCGDTVHLSLISHKESLT